MVNLKGLDFKKPENQLDLKVVLPFATGRSRGKVLVFAKSKGFADELKGKADRVIMESDIQGLNKKDVSQIIEEFDVLLAEGSVMLTVGRFLGQQLAPKNKMPRPIQASVAQVDASLAEMSSVTKVSNKKGKAMPVMQVVIGNEKMQDEQLAANGFAVFNAVLDSVPGKSQSIKSVFLKETMGPAIKVGDRE